MPGMRQAILAQNGKPAAATQNGSDLQEHFAFLQLRVQNKELWTEKNINQLTALVANGEK
jgi:hypothetical protein